MGKGRSRERGWPTDPEPLPGPVIDNHTHLDFVRAMAAQQATADPAQAMQPGDGGPWAPGGVPSIRDHIERARRVGVVGMVTVGCDIESAAWTDRIVWELANDPQTSGTLLGAVAIHPNEATAHAGVDEIGPDGLDPVHDPRHDVPLDEAIAAIEALARGNDRIRAIGETGMDLFRTGPQGAAVQREAFRAHIALAKELGLALQIHDRDAHREVLEVLKQDKAPDRTVFHCFSGDAAMAQECAAHGWFLSFAGPITFRANDGLRAALAVTPDDLVLVETDAPFLTPDPFRGRPNAPFVLPLTVRTVANVTGQSLAKICSQVSTNAHAVYGPW
jgi:TatD DNase family protein